MHIGYARKCGSILKQRNWHSCGKIVDAVSAVVLYPCDERTSFDSSDPYIWSYLKGNSSLWLSSPCCFGCNEMLPNVVDSQWSNCYLSIPRESKAVIPFFPQDPSVPVCLGREGGSTFFHAGRYSLLFSLLLRYSFFIFFCQSLIISVIIYW